MRCGQGNQGNGKPTYTTQVGNILGNISLVFFYQFWTQFSILVNFSVQKFSILSKIQRIIVAQKMFLYLFILRIRKKHVYKYNIYTYIRYLPVFWILDKSRFLKNDFFLKLLIKSLINRRYIILNFYYISKTLIKINR